MKHKTAKSGRLQKTNKQKKNILKKTNKTNVKAKFGIKLKGDIVTAEPTIINIK